ncbi:hypothetical protein FA95DRAFT_157510 [Auriscalpium vulgare]|uniref:Uncharacterized protein n=1 Tax=Auriscalpium vulgare TaxID=40419 RepID=A0ACB8RNL5_9AGAM|nr:hypothetical protein FA95DRAFT_157510 [Auriscalpium vulgare]
MHSDTFGPPPAHSTPVREVAVNATPSQIPSTLEFPDPPTPELGSTTSPVAAASLSNDLASILNTISSVFSAHPELSESMRNLLRNVNSGSYWASHRESVHRAAEDIRRAAMQFQETAAETAQDARAAATNTAQNMQTAAQEAHRIAEEEAGRRVTEAIGNVLRSFGVASEPGQTPVGTESGPPDAPPGEPRGHRGPPPHHHPHHHHGGPHHHHGGPRHHHGGHHGQHRHSRRGSRSPPPSPPSPGPGHSFHSHWAHGPPPPPPPILTGGWSTWLPSPGMVPPPPGAAPPPPPPPGMSPLSAPGPYQPSVAPFGPGPFTGPPQIPPWSQFRPYAGPDGSSGAAEEAAPFAVPPPPEVSYYGASPSFSRRPSGASGAKSRLDNAKENYKAEKERYRREREERRKEKEAREESIPDSQASAEPSKDDQTATPRPTTPVRSPEDNRSASWMPSATQIISNARGSFPQLEMFSVRSPRSPRRYHTITGATRHRDVPKVDEETHNDEASKEVTQQVVDTLNDMGFTEAEFPTMQDIVSVHIPQAGGRISQDAEAEVVGNVVEVLLSTSQATAESPRASGSRERQEAFTDNSAASGSHQNDGSEWQ